MNIQDTFSPVKWEAEKNNILLASVSEYRNQIGEIPRFRLLRQIKKARVKTAYPLGWKFDK